jgi:PAS domain S-box-containing protein
MHEARPLLRHLGKSLSLALSALLLTLVFWPLCRFFPPALFLLAVLLGAWLWGAGQGLSVTGASLLALLFIFRNSGAEDLMAWGEVGGRLTLFGLVGGLASFLGQQCRRAMTAVDRVQATLASVHDALLFADRDSKVRFLNAAAEALTGWRLEDAAHQPLDKVFPCVQEADQKPVMISPTEVLTSGNVCELPSDAMLKTRGGQLLFIDGKTAPHRNENREVTGLIVAFRDVSKRRQEERACRQRDEQFRSLAGAAPVALLFFDPQGKCGYANPAWQSASGLGPPESQGDGWQRGLHPEDRGSLVTELQHALRAGRDFCDECRLQARREETRWVYLRSTPMLGDRGQLLGHVVVVEDIDARKQAEAKLRVSENRFTSFMRNLPGLAFVKDAAGRYVYANDTYARTFDLEPGECEGKTDAELLSAGQANPFCTQADLVLEVGEPHESEQVVRRKAGAQSYLVRQFAVPGAEEDEFLLGGIALDISAQKEAEQSLQAARGDFERKWQERAGDLKRAEEAMRKARADLEKHLGDCSARQKQAEDALRSARQELEQRTAEQRRQHDELTAARRKTEEALKAATELLDEQSAEQDQALAALRQQLAEKDRELETLRQRPDHSEQVRVLTAQKAELERERDALREQRNRLESELAALTAELEVLRRGLTAVRASPPSSPTASSESVAEPLTEAVTHQILVNSWRLVESMDSWRVRETPVDWLSYN